MLYCEPMLFTVTAASGHLKPIHLQCQWAAVDGPDALASMRRWMEREGYLPSRVSWTLLATNEDEPHADPSGLFISHTNRP